MSTATQVLVSEQQQQQQRQQKHHHDEQQQQQHNVKEEFDDDGNTKSVANLTFIHGILGKGEYGTVRLARRHLSTVGTCSTSHEEEEEDGSSGSESLSTDFVFHSSHSNMMTTTPDNSFHKSASAALQYNPSPKTPGRSSTFIPMMPMIPSAATTTTATTAMTAPSSPTNNNKGVGVNCQTTRKRSVEKAGPNATTPRQSSRARPSMLRSASAPPGDDFFKLTEQERAALYGNNSSSNKRGFLGAAAGAPPSIPTLTAAACGMGGSGHNNNNNNNANHFLNNLLHLSRHSNNSSNHHHHQHQHHGGYDYDDDDDEDYCSVDEQLVAVKIFQKSILKRIRTMHRNRETRRVEIKTALEKVEREIALMKKLSHPNLVQFYDAIDSPDSDLLYMVIEYMPLGEILTYQNDGTFRRKEPKKRHQEPIDGLVDGGHFDEFHAALYFVDILHGLAYLHQHHIVHRDLKPENILLDARGIAKLCDFGVSHMFQDAEDNASNTCGGGISSSGNSGGGSSSSGTSPPTSSSQNGGSSDDKNNDSSNNSNRNKKSFEHSSSSVSVNTAATPLNHGPSLSRTQSAPIPASSPSPAPPAPSPGLTRQDTDNALAMKGMADAGLMTKTEGTWAFWSPEMCSGASFSGYAADLWAAGVCLYIFVTGRLPFFSNVPLDLMDMIRAGSVPYDGLGLSEPLVQLLRMTLEVDPAKRAGVGDCLKHEFLLLPRAQRIQELSVELARSKATCTVVEEKDIRSAFRIVTSMPAVLLKTATKQIQEGFHAARQRLSIGSGANSRNSSFSERDHTMFHSHHHHHSSHRNHHHHEHYRRGVAPRKSASFEDASVYDGNGGNGNGSRHAAVYNGHNSTGALFGGTTADATAAASPVPTALLPSVISEVSRDFDESEDIMLRASTGAAAAAAASSSSSAAAAAAAGPGNTTSGSGGGVHGDNDDGGGSDSVDSDKGSYEDKQLRQQRRRQHGSSTSNGPVVDGGAGGNGSGSRPSTNRHGSLSGLFGLKRCNGGRSSTNRLSATYSEAYAKVAAMFRRRRESKSPSSDGGGVGSSARRLGGAAVKERRLLGSQQHHHQHGGGAGGARAGGALSLSASSSASSPSILYARKRSDVSTMSLEECDESATGGCCGGDEDDTPSSPTRNARTTLAGAAAATAMVAEEEGEHDDDDDDDDKSTDAHMRSRIHAAIRSGFRSLKRSASLSSSSSSSSSNRNRQQRQHQQRSQCCGGW